MAKVKGQNWIAVALVCIGIIIFAFPVFAQEPKPKLYTITFDGGLVNNYNSILMKDNQALDMVNFEFDEGVLKKRNGSLALYNANSQFSFYINRIFKFNLGDNITKYALSDGQKTYWTNTFTDTYNIVRTTSRRQDNEMGLANYKGKLFTYNGGANVFQRYDGLRNVNVGTPAPPILSTHTDTGCTGTFRYCLSYISSGGVCSLGEPSDTISITNASVRLAFQHDYWADFSSVRIYRTGTAADTTAWYLVDTVGDSVDIYHDTKDTISTTTLYNMDDDIIIPRPKFAVVYYDKLATAGMTEFPSSVWFSFTKFPDIYDPYDRRDINVDNGDKISGLFPYKGDLIIFEFDYMYKLVGTDLVVGMQTVEISPNVGCVNINTAKIGPNGDLIFMARDGQYSYDGSALKRISEDIKPSFDAFKYPYIKKKNLIVGSWADWKQGTLVGDSISWDSEPGRLVFENGIGNGTDTYTSKIFYVGDTIAYWGDINVEYTNPCGSSDSAPVFQIRADSTIAGISANSWTTKTNGESLNIGATNVYIQFRMYSKAYSTAFYNRIKIENVEITWAEGETWNYVTAEIYDNKYWLSCQTNTGTEYNIIYNYDRYGRWTRYGTMYTKGFDPPTTRLPFHNYTLFNFNNKLLSGTNMQSQNGSLSRGKMVVHLDHNDTNGATHDAFTDYGIGQVGGLNQSSYTTKIFDFGDPNSTKYYEAIRYTVNLPEYLTGDTQVIYIDYKVDNDTSWTTIQDTASEYNIPATVNGNGQYNKKVFLPTLETGKTIQFRIRDTNDYRYELIRLDVIYNIQDDWYSDEQ